MSSQHRPLAASRQDEYRILPEGELRDYLARLPAIAEQLGGAPETWSIEEVGDGNLNLVFLIRGPAGSLCAKQALPYVRLVGESWPLPLSRAHFEHIALVEEAKHAPDLVPVVHLFDPVASMTVMDCLDGHIIMRKGMIQAVRYPRFAADIARFLARRSSAPPTWRCRRARRSAASPNSAATSCCGRSRRT